MTTRRNAHFGAPFVFTHDDQTRAWQPNSAAAPDYSAGALSRKVRGWLIAGWLTADWLIADWLIEVRFIHVCSSTNPKTNTGSM